MTVPPAAPSDAECDAALRRTWDCTYVLVQADLPIYRAIYRAALAAPRDGPTLAEAYQGGRYAERQLTAHAPPREPTPAMIDAGEELYRTAPGTESRKIGGAPDPDDVWRAMYDAAPAQEQAQAHRIGFIMGEPHVIRPPAPPDLVRRLRQRFVDAADALASEAADAIESRDRAYREYARRRDETLASVIAEQAEARAEAQAKVIAAADAMTTEARACPQSWAEARDNYDALRSKLKEDEHG